MEQSHSDKAEWAPASAFWAHAGAPSAGARPERRFSAQRKLAAVTRLLRGEPLESVALSGLSTALLLAGVSKPSTDALASARSTPS